MKHNVCLFSNFCLLLYRLRSEAKLVCEKRNHSDECALWQGYWLPYGYANCIKRNHYGKGVI